MSLYLFWGQEDYNIQKEIEKLKNELLDSSFVSMNYKIFDNPDFIKIIEIVQTTPLMFGNMLIVINCDKYLIGNKGSVDDKQLAVFSQAIENISPNVNIIFLCKISRDENKKIDTRKKLYKIISKVATVKEFHQYRTYQKELFQQIQGMFKEKELTADIKVAEYVAEQLGANLRLIDSEIEKLKVAIHPNKKASIEDIKKYCTSSEDVFALADLIVAQDKNNILSQFHKLIDKRHYLEILSVLQTNIQKFIFIKNYEKKASAQEIGSQLNLHEFVVKKTIEKLSKVNLSQLIKIKQNLTKAEYKIKTGAMESPTVALEMALLG